MILIRRYDPDEPEDTRPIEEQLLEAMLQPLGEYPETTDHTTSSLRLMGHKVETADVNPELL